jgi:cytochrome P450
MTSTYPETDIDLYTEEALLDPFPLYRHLREMASAVWLKKHNIMALSRYKDVAEAMRNWQLFSSAQGVIMNDRMNDTLRGIVLRSDEPEHAVLRRVISKPLTPLAIKAYSTLITLEAEALVERLVSRKHFNAATDLAQ